MPRKPPKLMPVDPGPAELTLDQLVADGVAKKSEALRLLSVSETRLKQLVRRGLIVSWKDGRDRVYPRVGLRAYLATTAREQGVKGR